MTADQRPAPVLRRATGADVEAIGALVHAAYVGYIELLGRKPMPMLADYDAAVRDHEVWVLEEDAGIVGVLELIDRGDEVWVENVAIDPGHQRRGHGRRLLAHAEAVARERGRPHVGLLTNERYVDNVAMYRHYGYVETHREPLKGSNVIHFRKQLD